MTAFIQLQAPWPTISLRNGKLHKNSSNKDCIKIAQRFYFNFSRFLESIEPFIALHDVSNVMYWV